MDGVTVLNTFEKLDYTAIVIASAAIVCAALSFIAVIAAYKDEASGWDKLLAIFGVIFSLAVALLSGIATKSVTYQQITVNDNVSFVDFDNQYRVISKEGNIYTVIEREND